MTGAHGRGRRARLVVAAFALALALVPGPGAAQPDGFAHSAEVYLMGASMSGTVGAGALEAEIDVPSSAVFENLDFAVLAVYRGEAPRWAVTADVVYMNLGRNGAGSLGQGAWDVGVEEFIFDLVGAYRVSKSFEVLAGGRYTALRTELAVSTPLYGREARVDKGWFDPVVGAQAFLPLSKAFQVQLRGDVGGFGVGCDFTWQATARVNWQVSPAIRLGLGYRWLDQDYETGSGSDSFSWNVLTQGPLVAAGVSF